MKIIILFLLALLIFGRAEAQISCSSYLNIYTTIPQATVSNLPVCNSGSNGQIYIATNLLTPTVLGIVAGGGAVVALVHCNGTNWLVG